ncbi:MAG TPA: hypothetical protein VIA06_23965 [Candidatus Dormibacteraeota bacterium]|nr:hypothetical protein [Candidatus Dormibacteraeota bacterium]
MSEEDPRRVLAELKATRQARHPRPKGMMLIGLLEMAAMVWAFAAAGLWLLVQGRTLDAPSVALVHRAGPGAIGMLMALLLGASLRTGLQGGPLAPARPDVLQLLLAPVERAWVLRPLAGRRLLMTVGAAALFGATLGGVSQARLGGSIFVWALCGAVAGALAGLLTTAPGMIVSGRRLGRAWAVIPPMALGAVSLVDAVTGFGISPTTWIGEIALWPLRAAPAALAAVPLGVILALVALFSVGGSRLAPLSRRSGQIAEVRYTASMLDLRGFMRARAVLAEEGPRHRAWLRIRGLAGARWTVWTRHLRSLLRWPAWRVLRVLGLALATGAATALTWAGSSYFIIPAALLAYLVGLELLEPWWQDVDHGQLTDQLPLSRSRLLEWHLIAAIVTAAVASVPLLICLIVLRLPWIELGAAALGMIPAAACAVIGSALRSNPEPTIVERLTEGMSATGDPVVDTGILAASMVRVIRLIVPPCLCLAGLIPVLVARSDLLQHRDPFVPELIAAAIVIVLSRLLASGLARISLFLLEQP